ncbi:hypothetical protein POTOM_041944 [Populus tomentosa]|uniref:RRM domain-containing protein n=1 Tax=Populus tomentosa TaxID=118781 RepID=A0A8X8CH80_POPTO|nr:hypothetical protein POTOM_041944 [Populus tomentosa]
MLRQTTSKQMASEISASRPSIYQAMRCMSSSKLLVGDDNSLKKAFDKYGNVVKARIIMDRETGRSRGFGFVTYTSSEEASSAIQALDGQDLYGRRVRVNYATERPQRYGSSGGYGTNVGGNQGGRNATYGGNDGNYVVQNTFDGGAGNYDNAGGGGGSDSYADTNADGGYDGNVGLGYGSNNQFGANNSSDGVFNPDDALDANYKDKDDAGDFAKKA